MKINPKGITIETAVEAILFGDDALGSLYTFGELYVSREEVLEAITPKEGDAVFWWMEDDTITNTPQYATARVTWIHPNVKANAITIGLTVGELRELLEWAGGEGEKG